MPVGDPDPRNAKTPHRSITVVETRSSTTRLNNPSSNLTSKMTGMFRSHRVPLLLALTGAGLLVISGLAWADGDSESQRNNQFR